MKHKCIIILSAKSSGSSACQNYLCKSGEVKHLTKTRHGENETLYWTKAASILGLNQISMLDSEVPIRSDKAKKDLIKLLKDNLGYYEPPQDDKKFIFDGWKKLCMKFSPIFLEKSPHHLLQWSNLELIKEFVKSEKDIDIHIVGLIRNPMDTLYSAWTRWKTIPEKNQLQWKISYQNLLLLKEQLKGQVHIIRYEDMISNPSTLNDEFEFIGQNGNLNKQSYFHKKSISKWRKDKLFGFRLADDVIDLAKDYGYKDEDMQNEATGLWPYYKMIARWYEVILERIRPVKHLLKRVLAHK